MTSILLPPGFVTRPATLQDAEAIAALNVEIELALLGVSESAAVDVLEFWQDRDVNLESDTLAVTAPTGEFVGYTSVARTRRGIMLDANTAIRLSYQQQPISAYLLQFAEEHARTLLDTYPETPRTFYTWSFTRDMSHLLTQAGFEVESSDYRMRILFEEPPMASRPIEGVTIRPFIPGQEERAIYHVVAEAFPDIDGEPYRPYADWYEGMFEKNSSADPSMFYVAITDGEVVGVTLCRIYPQEHNGHVSQVGVRRPWRKRGIALALLSTAFNEYYRRGVREVLLDMDSTNQTGAWNLYHRAGMHVRSQVDFMTKSI